MICGLDSALSLIVTPPNSFPLAVGVKFTLITQLAPATTVPPLVQVFPAANAKLPLMLKLLRMSDVVPGLVSFTVLAALVVPTF